MSNPDDFIIENGVLKKYVGPGGDVVIPDGVTSIGNGAFEDCYSIKTVFIPDGVKKIGKDAFKNCRKLSGIRLPASLSSIDNNAFRECRELTQLDICDVAAWCAVTLANDYAHPLYESGKGNWRMNVPGKSGSLLLNGRPVCELVIPEGVCEIAQSVFTNCGSITAVSIPPSLKKIDPNAFYNCAQIKTVNIRDLNAWNSISFTAKPGWGTSYTGSAANPLRNGAVLVLNGEVITELRLSGELKEIGDHVFSGCGSLTSVTFEEGIARIGQNAFQGCGSLHSVFVPKSMRKIDYDAFNGCKNLHVVYIEDLGAWLRMDQNSGGLLSNGADLLLHGEPVREITITEELTKINSHAFDGCRSLTSVTIPEGVTSIGGAAFEGCENLTCVMIPESVKTIYPDAFQNCSNLKSVTIPGGVTSIGNDAFNGCSKLEAVTIPASASSIGYGAFKGCESLRHVTLLASPAVTGWGESWDTPFAGCKTDVWVAQWTKNTTKLLANAELRAIHTDSISAVPSMYRALAALGFAAEEKQDLSTTRAAEHMAFLKKHAAKLCSQMMEHPEAVYFLCEQKLLPAAALDEYMKVATEHNNVELKARLLSYQNELGHGAVSKARAKKEKVKEEYEDALVERMADRDPSKGIEGLTFVITGKMSYAWKSKTEVKEYLESYGAKLGSSVTKQTDYLVATSEADSNSEKSRKARDYGAQVITEEEFNKMVGWRYKDAVQIAIPAWVKSIPENAFSHCDKLTDITIPEGVTSIGKSAFSLCRNMTSITIPASLKSVGVHAFYSSQKLRRVNICNMKAWCEIDFDTSSNPISRDMFDDKGPANSRQLFLDGTPVRDLIIPDGVQQIGRYAFQDYSLLTSVVIPEGVTSIGECAFANCGNLTSVTIPKSLKNIGRGAFLDCKNLKTIHISDLKAWCEIKFECWGHPLSCAESLLLNGEEIRNLVIPDGVSTISDYAFVNYKMLTSVTIPDSVTDIGSSAFLECSGLSADAEGFVIVGTLLVAYKGSDTNVTIPEGVTGIGGSAFSGCSSLESVTIPDSVTSIGSSAFSGCSSLESVTIPDSVTSIGSSAFSGCSSLTSVMIPAGVTEIEAHSFQYCGNLSSVTLPESLTSIGSWTFYNCSSLMDITIPKSVRSIGSLAFYGCKKLNEITIPEGVTSIDYGTFSGCRSLTDITIPASVKKINSQAFEKCPKLTIHRLGDLE